MAKKSFKSVADDNPALAFLGKQSDENVQPIQNEDAVYSVHDIQQIHNEHDIHDVQQIQNKYHVHDVQYCNINLRITKKMKDFLTDESWKSRMNVTQYINALINADMDVKQRLGGKE